MIETDSADPQEWLATAAAEGLEVTRMHPVVLVLTTTFHPEVRGTTTAVADLVGGLKASMGIITLHFTSQAPTT